MLSDLHIAMGFSPGSLAVRCADLESREGLSGSSGEEEAYRDRESPCSFPRHPGMCGFPSREELGLRREGRAVPEV